MGLMLMSLWRRLQTDNIRGKKQLWHDNRSCFFVAAQKKPHSPDACANGLCGLEFYENQMSANDCSASFAQIAS